MVSSQLQARINGDVLQVTHIDKFPRMTNYVVPAGVRIAHSARGRGILLDNSVIPHALQVLRIPSSSSSSSAVFLFWLLHPRVSKLSLLGDTWCLPNWAGVCSELLGQSADRDRCGRLELLDIRTELHGNLAFGPGGDGIWWQLPW